jgi:hypothetical protein
MAVIEAVKALLPLRAQFHHDEIARWLKGEHHSLDARLMGVGYDALPSASDQPTALKQLLHLAIGGESYQTALFEQPAEKMFGQVQAAVNIALDFPDVAPNLYEFLTHEPGTERKGELRVAAKLNATKEAALFKTSDQDLWSRFAADLNAGKVDLKTQDPRKKQEYLEANQARQRLDNLVRRRLDALQTRTAYRWGRYNQFAAFGLAVIFALIALWNADLNPLVKGIFAVAAGFLAPPAKDLAAALKQIRYR